MTFRTYTKKGVFFHAVYIAILTVSGILAVYSAVFGALHISCKEDKIALGFTVFFALLIISVDFFECRAMGARIYTNPEGIGVRRFGFYKMERNQGSRHRKHSYAVWKQATHLFLRQST